MNSKIKVFNYSNINEITSKSPTICYYSENGACGPSGLFYVIFDDGSLYAYSTYYEKSDMKLIKNIICHAPELRSLIYLDDETSPERKCRNDMVSIYLGLGNHGLICEHIYSDIHEKLDYRTFIKLSEKIVGSSLKSVFEMVNSKINKQ